MALPRSSRARVALAGALALASLARALRVAALAGALALASLACAPRGLELPPDDPTREGPPARGTCPAAWPESACPRGYRVVCERDPLTGCDLCDCMR
ncbi:MAG: hypothetical protein JNL38_13550 [Myxococcales bacterium]|nr:hypothetical protein [Myxococcales bacterium]